MLNKHCPICENELKITKDKTNIINQCNCCVWYKEVQDTVGTITYYIGNKRKFSENEKEDMHFFILLKREELKDLIKRLNNLNSTFSQQAERIAPLCNTAEGKLVWKNIQENKELALKTLKKLNKKE